MITKKNILILQKEIPECSMLNVGERFNVENISSTGVITISSPKGIGMITYNEFEEYFVVEKPEPARAIRRWSKWNELNGSLIIEGEKIQVEYRTNGKKVEVRTMDLVGGSVKSQATCHDDDTFDVGKGLELSLVRLKLKLLTMIL